jgi:hypothetical protein
MNSCIIHDLVLLDAEIFTKIRIGVKDTFITRIYAEA